MGFNSAFKGLNYITHKTTIKIHKIYFGGVCVRKLYQGNKSQTRQHYIRRTFKFIYQTFFVYFDFSFLGRGNIDIDIDIDIDLVFTNTNPIARFFSSF